MDIIIEGIKKKYNKMKRIKLFEDFDYIKKAKEKGLKALKDMYKTVKRHDFSDSFSYASYSVLYDEWILKGKGHFQLNAFDTKDTYLHGDITVTDNSHFKSYVEELKKLGAKNIRVGGFELSHGNDLYETPNPDSLYFKISKKGYEKAIEVEPTPDEYDFNFVDGFTRFWWD